MQNSSYPDINKLIEDFKNLGSNPEQEAVFALFSNIEIHLKIEAPNFNGTITGDLGKAISEIQSNLQRLWCFALHDSQNLISDPAIRKNIVLAFQVSNGSTNLLESVGSVLDKLKSIKGVQEMKPWQWFILGLTAIICFSAYKTYQEYLGNEKNEAAIKAILESQSSSYKHDEELLTLAFNKQNENVITIARSVPQATKLIYGSKSLNENELNSFRKPSSKEEAVLSSITGKFVIFQVCNLANSDMQIKVKKIPTDEEFSVRVNNDLFAEPDTYDKIWEYAKNQTPVRLQISEARKTSGSVYRLEALDIE